VAARLGEDPGRERYVVYVNPVHGAVLDASPYLRRRHASTAPYAPEELGFGPGADDTVVVWESGVGGPPAGGAADRPIRVDASGWRAELDPA
jgi:hypothetical protein